VGRNRQQSRERMRRRRNLGKVCLFAKSDVSHPESVVKTGDYSSFWSGQPRLQRWTRPGSKQLIYQSVSVILWIGRVFAKRGLYIQCRCKALSWMA
jgi:hypothetical protein